jgi:cytochrome b561
MWRSLFFVPALNECLVARDGRILYLTILILCVVGVLMSSAEGISTSYIVIGQANTRRKALFDINMEYKT